MLTQHSLYVSHDNDPNSITWTHGVASLIKEG